MEETTTREKVFKSIRDALIEKADNPVPDVDTESNIYRQDEESPDVVFASAFTAVGGKFVYCEDGLDLGAKLQYIISRYHKPAVYCFEKELQPLLEKFHPEYHDDRDSIQKASIGISLCECLVARTGSVMLSSRQPSGRRMNAAPEVHIIIAETSQLVDDIREAFALLRKKYGDNIPSAISMVTGPSRTADIEKTLVMGAHGPRELYLLMVE